MLFQGDYRGGLYGLHSGGDVFVVNRSSAQAALLESEQIDGLLEIAGIEGVQDILAAFWRSTDELSADLFRCAQSGEFELAARTAHALKGSAANVGAQRLAQAARDIEIQSKLCDPAAACAAVERLAAVYRDTRAELERHLAAHV